MRLTHYLWSRNSRHSPQFSTDAKRENWRDRWSVRLYDTCLSDRRTHVVRYQDVGSCGAPSGQISVSGPRRPITSSEEKEECGQSERHGGVRGCENACFLPCAKGQNRSIIKLKPFLRATSDATAESELPFLHHTTSAPHANLPQKCQSRSNTHFHPCLIMRPTEVNLLIYDIV